MLTGAASRNPEMPLVSLHWGEATPRNHTKQPVQRDYQTDAGRDEDMNAYYCQKEISS